MENYIKIKHCEDADYIKAVSGMTYEELSSLPEAVICNKATEDEFVLLPEEKIGIFHIISLDIDDFEKFGSPELTTEEYKAIAEEMAEYFVESGEYNEHLREIMEELGHEVED